MVDDNRLENLNKEKPAHHEYGYKYAIPMEKVDKLFLLLTSDMPLTVAAKEVGIKFETAKKYFELGDPRRGIQPLKRRLAILRYKRTEKMDKSIVRRQRYLLAVIRRLISKVRKELIAGDSKATYTALEKLVKLELIISNKNVSKEEEGTAMYSAEDMKTLASKVENDEAVLKSGEETDGNSGSETGAATGD